MGHIVDSVAPLLRPEPVDCFTEQACNLPARSGGYPANKPGGAAEQPVDHACIPLSSFQYPQRVVMQYRSRCACGDRRLRELGSRTLGCASRACASPGKVYGRMPKRSIGFAPGALKDDVLSVERTTGAGGHIKRVECRAAALRSALSCFLSRAWEARGRFQGRPRACRCPLLRAR